MSSHKICFCEVIRIKHQYLLVEKKKCLSFNPWSGNFFNCYNFIISAKNIDCGYSSELSHQGSSNEYSQSMYYENYQNFSSESFHFLVVKFSICLNRHIFVMIICTMVKYTEKFYSCHTAPNSGCSKVK